MLPGTGSVLLMSEPKVSEILLTSISWLQDGCWSSSHRVYVSVKKGKHFVERLPVISNWLKLDHERDWESSWLTWHPARRKSSFSFKDPPGDSGVLLLSCPLEMFGDIFTLLTAGVILSFSEWRSVRLLNITQCTVSPTQKQRIFWSKMAIELRLRNLFSLLQKSLDHCADFLPLQSIFLEFCLMKQPALLILPEALLQSECSLYVHQGKKSSGSLNLFLK